ncbi:MAG: OmpA family protein [Bacteroidota bacterium]
MRYSIILVVFFQLISGLAYAQLGDIPSELIKLGDSINSRKHETAPLVTPDGNTLFFSRTNQVTKEQLIWYSERDIDGFWKKAKLLENPLNQRAQNQVLTILDDGNTLFLQGGPGKKDPGFSMTRRSGNGWSSPKEVNVKGFSNMNKGLFSGATMSQDQQHIILYFNEREKKQYSDLYLSTRQPNGSYSKPVIIESLSTARDEFGPYLYDNDQILFFGSNRPGSTGSTDIFKVKRLDDTWLSWSEPENIGEPINTGGFDAYFSLDSDGTHAYTTRTYKSPDGSNLDIYGLVPKPKIEIKGTVLDAETKKPVSLSFTATLSDGDAHEVSSDPAGKYSFTVYDKGEYTFYGFKEGYNDLEDTLDLSFARQDTIIEKDLLIQPRKAEILIYGYVTDATSGLPIESEIKITSDGKTITANSSFEDGYYKTVLFGTGTYQVSVQKEFYEPFSTEVTIDLPDDTFYKEVSQDITLTKALQPYVITGKVYDQKTSEPIEVTLDFDLDNETLTTAKTDLEYDGFYEAKVFKPGVFHIRATKEGYLNLDDSINIFDNQDFLSYDKDLFMVPIEVGATVVINNIYFDFDKSTLKKESFPELDRLVELLSFNSTIRIEIAGHTDDKGSDDYNLELSQGRADAVRQYLSENGIDASRIESKGYGETSPVATNFTDEGRAQNRRVEFTILSL